MRCKKEIMGLAALMVVFFHFYIPFGTSALETYIYRSTYIGVDMFFFVSAYSIVSRSAKEKFNALGFILNRLCLIYIPFVILAIINGLYRKWSLTQFFKVIGGVEFYERGGGAFLWYFIGITIVYLFVPLFLLIKRKMKIWGLPILLSIWLTISCILQFGLHYTKMFIFINRLPIFFIAMYFDELILNNLRKLDKIYLYLIEAALFISGTALVYKFGTTKRLLVPFGDMYYVIAIPLIIATVLIVNTIVELLNGKYKSIILKFIGGITLELYGLQMVFGYDIEGKILKFVTTNISKSAAWLAFVGTVLALIALAFIFNKLLGFVTKPLSKLVAKATK